MSDSAPAPQKAWKNLTLRVATALALSAVCFLPFYFGGMAWVIVVAALALIVIWEWIKMSDPQGRYEPLVIAMAGLVVFATYAFLENWTGVWITLAITVIAAALERRPRGGTGWAVFGILYIYLPVLSFIWLRGGGYGFGSIGFETLFYLILVVAAADTGAFFGGRSIGGPKLAPKLSPKKTWSGFISGIIAGMLVGAACSLFLSPSYIVTALVAIPIVIIAAFGDLFESAIKRRLQVKDSGDFLPGHGGILDRIDSLIMVVLVAAAITLAHVALV